MRYAAFISYSHQDAAWARWLHRALERYRVPGRLAGNAGEYGTVPERLRPVFRDREELTSAGDLGERIRTAITESAAMIVLCSPAAAKSPWVDREIRAFRRQHGSQRLHAAIVAGDPPACFPPALCDDTGGNMLEPIAADLREGRDGKRLARLKLVAGLLGVGLDDLRRREYQRQQRRLLAIAAGALAGMALTGYLAISATIARNDAQRRQAQGEGLIEFMLTDLKDRLEPMQRLDALDAVGGKAVAYLAALPARDMNDSTLSRRSQALRQLGEVYSRRREWAQARQAFDEALRMDEEMLARRPDDLQRRFNLAQSQFWVGSVETNTGRYAQALAAFEAYMAHAEMLHAAEPDNPDWRMEVGYGHANLAAIHDLTGQQARALEHSRHAVAAMRAAADVRPDDAGILGELANAIAWLATAQATSGALTESLASRQAASDIYRRLQAGNPADRRLDYRLALAIRGEGNILSDLGRGGEAAARLTEAADMLSSLVRHDPENLDWSSMHADVVRDLVRARLAHDIGGPIEHESLSTLRRYALPMPDDPPTQLLDRARARVVAGHALARQGEQILGIAEIDSAISTLDELSDHVDAGSAVLETLADAMLIRRTIAADPADAAQLQRVHDRLALLELTHPSLNQGAARARLLMALDRAGDARPLVERLLAANYAEPGFMRACRRQHLCPRR